MIQLASQIQELEEKLLHENMQENPLLLDALLAETFLEIGYSGKMSSRQEVVDWLINKPITDRWILSNFCVNLLSPDIVLAVYQAQKINDSVQISKTSTRSSIWKRYGRQWKMMFHQASKSV